MMPKPQKKSLKVKAIQKRNPKPKPQAIVKREPLTLAESVEKVLIAGDLAPLNVDQRLEYYKKVCLSLGLNPLTRPFGYIVFRESEQGPGRLGLYALKDCTEQLRKLYGVGVEKLTREMSEELCLVEVTVR